MAEPRTYRGAEMYAGLSHAALWSVTASMPTGQTDKQIDGLQTVTLRFPLNTASVLTTKVDLLTIYSK